MAAQSAAPPVVRGKAAIPTARSASPDGLGRTSITRGTFPATVNEAPPDAEDLDEFLQERAAIAECDGGLSRQDAERQAMQDAVAQWPQRADLDRPDLPPDDELPPVELYADEPQVQARTDGQTPPPEPPPQIVPHRSPIDWRGLQGREPPEREWIIPHWIPAGHMTLLAGRGGIGKTLIAQHIAAALALGHEYIEPLERRRVLMWAGEDDEAELWRRQVQISSWMGSPLASLADRCIVHSYAGHDITLMEPIYGALTPTPMLAELAQQVRDYRAQVVILDNVARLYGGSENDRHGVTTFCALVQGACAPAAVILLAHPAKAAGSEYSGSTAWEGAVRARLYLSDRQPDEEPDEAAPIDDSVRYLSRRKANYSPRDIRRLRLLDGVLIPDTADPAQTARPRGQILQDIVRRAIGKLAERGIYGSAKSSRASNYLPKLAKQYKLLENATEKDFASAMRDMIMAGTLTEREVGKYGNRTTKMGLTVPSGQPPDTL